MPYQEPSNDLSPETRDMHRAIESLKEEFDAIDSYNQRIDDASDKELKALLAHNANEEKEHAAMLIEWIRRKDQSFSKELKDWVFSDKAFVHN
ncbi:MAG: hypothetical protein WC464_03200 [Bdellovibrionales bacterium]